MIQRAFITEWRAKAPWVLDEQVEQDLILARALVDLYSEEVLQREVAFRGSNINAENLVRCFLRYLDDDGLRVSRAEFEANFLGKLSDAVFQRDIEPLLAMGTTWDQAAAAEYVLTQLAPLLPGEAWKGGE